MPVYNSRTSLLGRIGIAHAAGLWVAGMIGTIRSDSGFDMLGGAFVGALGGLMSIPWIAALVLLICFRPSWIGQHPVVFAIVGPVLVSGSWVLLAGQAMLDSVAISSAVSSVAWLAIVFATPVWRVVMARVTDSPSSRSVR